MPPSLPNYRFRLDVAGYRPERIRVADSVRRAAWQQAVGVTAVFECAASLSRTWSALVDIERRGKKHAWVSPDEAR